MHEKRIRQLQDKIIAGLPSDLEESCRRRELEHSKIIVRLPPDRGHFEGELVYTFSTFTELFSESDKLSPVPPLREWTTGYNLRFVILLSRNDTLS